MPACLMVIVVFGKVILFGQLADNLMIGCWNDKFLLDQLCTTLTLLLSDMFDGEQACFILGPGKEFDWFHALAAVDYVL